MGANFCEMTLPGTTNPAELAKAFSRAQDTDRYENGHSYSGGFGMASGLANKHPIVPTFADSDAARDWLMDHAQKWDDALAVRFKDKDGAEQWMIGAWCAS